MENKMAVPQKLLCNSATPLLCTYPKELQAGTKTDTCPPMFIANIIHSNQKVKTIQISIIEWLNKMWYIHTMEYDSA